MPLASSTGFWCSRTKDSFSSISRAPDPIPSRIGSWTCSWPGGEFMADQVGMWISEMELEASDRELVSEHAAFFSSAERRAAYSAQVRGQRLSASAKRRWMLAICAGASGPDLDEILLVLLNDPKLEAGAAYKRIVAAGLDTFLWRQVQDAIGHAPGDGGGQPLDQPLLGMALALFRAVYQQSLDPASTGMAGAKSFLRRWQEGSPYREAFVRLSARAADAMNLVDDLPTRSLEDLQGIVLFRAVERRVASEMAARVQARTLTADACRELIERRRVSPWFEAYRCAYEAARLGAQLLETMHQADVRCQSAASAISMYVQTWFPHRSALSPVHRRLSRDNKPASGGRRPLRC